MNSRDNTVDIMRALGLILIILAHTIPYGTLVFQMRNFDVPMMAVVSGMAFAVSAPEKLNLLTYYWKRILRLLLPTWTFLTLFFLITFSVFSALGQEFPLAGKIKGTFMLENGPHTIGYVWIIRVFLLTAITAPLMLMLWRKTKPAVFAVILLVIYIAYECAFRFIPLPETVWLRKLVSDYVYYALPYSVMFGVGMLLSSFNWKGRLGTALLMAVVLVSCIFIFHVDGQPWFQPQKFKYPAQLYYVPWGLMMSAFLSFAFMKIPVRGWFQKSVNFLGSASLWVYFWHIVVISLTFWTPKLFGPTAKNGYPKFIMVLLVSVLLTVLHRYLFTKLAKAVPEASGFIKNAFLK